MRPPRLQPPRLLLPLLLALPLLLPPPPRAAAIRWLALSQAAAEWRRVNGTAAHAALCTRARRSLGLSRRQARLCRAAPDAWPHVAEAAAGALAACRLLLADRRWNCASAALAPHLGPDLTSGTREQAFAYALSSAAVAHAVARACARGALWGCACAEAPRTPPDGLFKWGGCGDNVRWAARFARTFTDGGERRGGGGGGAAAPVARLARRGHRWGRARGRGGRLSPPPQPRQGRRLAALMAAVNQHNNRAGRKAVEASLTRQCKCHGVSGACSVKTCWRALPPALAAGAGARLLRAFAAAVEPVRGRRVGGAGGRLALAPPPGQRELAFLAASPDYCEADPRTGSLGTRGRQCNVTSAGYDNCGQLCCGRGHRTVRQEREERCHCKYYWCCYVRCKTCIREVSLHTCN